MIKQVRLKVLNKINHFEYLRCLLSTTILPMELNILDFTLNKYFTNYKAHQIM